MRPLNNRPQLTFLEKVGPKRRSYGAVSCLAIYIIPSFLQFNSYPQKSSSHHFKLALQEHVWVRTKNNSIWNELFWEARLVARLKRACSDNYIEDSFWKDTYLLKKPHNYMEEDNRLIILMLQNYRFLNIHFHVAKLFLAQRDLNRQRSSEKRMQFEGITTRRKVHSWF